MTMSEGSEPGLEDEIAYSEYENVDTMFLVKNGLGAFTCVIIAALAAGLTMGLVSLEVLDLRIKELASSDPRERAQARRLIPLVQDHHRLLVTLLLLNAMANEALPLFLDKLFPAYVAIILSVTLVLFFGEIIPSAVFSGPNKIAISSAMAPLVKVVLFLLCPLAWPIAKLLDKLLHNDHNDDAVLQKYDKKELSALVKIQFEERMAAKAKRKMQKMEHTINSDKVESGLIRRESLTKDTPHAHSNRYLRHIDEVNMVQGALNMTTKMVFDVMVPWSDVYAIPSDLLLNEENIVDIYRRGFSRLPVYHIDGGQVCGVFKTKQLMIFNPEEARPLSQIPLQKPHCVSQEMNMIDVINLLQTGTEVNKGGQMALVCLNPALAYQALDNDTYIPSSAGVTGIVTLEDCLEELIQEEIYDEFDVEEKLRRKRAVWVVNKWKKFVSKKKTERATLSLSQIDATSNTENDFENEKTPLV